MELPTRPVRAVFSRIAAPSEGGVSFLEFLARRFPYHTAEEWKERVREGKVLLENRMADPDTRVERGMRIEYCVDGYEEPAVPLDFRELSCSDCLALVHKPAGLPVHKTGKVFVNVLANLYRAFKGDAGWTPLNRLDVETSGIVAFARGREALRRFSPGNAETRWSKTYLAVVEGVLTEGGSVDSPLGELAGDPIRTRMHPHPGGKPARTLFRPLFARANKTLVLVQPVTGRKHQIRVHLASIGHPVVGDKVYGHGGRYYLKRLEGELHADDHAVLGAQHQVLHAVSLEIRDSHGEGISGTDFNLPEPFPHYFPEATEESLTKHLHDLGVS